MARLRRSCNICTGFDTGWPEDDHSLLKNYDLFSALCGSLQSVTIPDTVGIQFSVLLKMSTSMLETCRGIQCNKCD